MDDEKVRQAYAKLTPEQLAYVDHWRTIWDMKPRSERQAAALSGVRSAEAAFERHGETCGQCGDFESMEICEAGSVLWAVVERELAELKAATEEVIPDIEAEIAESNAEIAERKAEIIRLREQMQGISHEEWLRHLERESIEIAIRYPSGNGFTVRGKWTGPIAVGDGGSIAIELEQDAVVNGQKMEAGSVVFGDPRGVYFDKTHERPLYEPRAHIGKGLPDWAERWLEEHPLWPDAGHPATSRGANRSDGVAGYLLALERQLEVLRWVAKPEALEYYETLIEYINQAYGHVDMTAAGAVAVIRETLNVAEPFYWNRETCALIDSAWKELPDWTLTPEQLPTTSGFWWFDEPINIHWERDPESDSRPFLVRAISWSYPWTGDRRSEIPVAVYFDFPRFPRASPYAIIPWPIGMPISKMPEEWQDADSFSIFAKIFAAGVLFLKQRIVAGSRQIVDRAIARRLGPPALKIEPAVRIVALRKIERPYTPVDERAEVDWSCRWIVSGHWRNQWMPGKGHHEPVWIAPYMKGPDDKPLKPPRGRVFAVVR